MADLSGPNGAQLQVVIGPNPPDRLDKALAREVPEEAALSRSRLAKMIAAGDVLRGGLPVAAKDRVAEGDVLVLQLSAPEDVDAQPEDIPLTILYEDDDLIVIDKPVGMVVHPAPGSPSGTLVNALLFHCAGSLSGIGGAKRPGIVHRIDKDTSGLLVAAKSDRAHHGLAAQFEAHSVTRRYVALIHGVPDKADPRLRGISGVSFEPGGILKIATQLDRHRNDRQRQAVVSHGGRHAVTRMRVLEDFGTAALVECWLETGRTHQIRVHMAHVGHGLLGDQTYGGKRKVAAKALGAAASEAAAAFPRQALHAATLGFVHPATEEELAFESPLPPDMQDLLDLLRAGAARNEDFKTET
ncbi:RluA family pseudouridine synthase [Falsirhodobacter algicola]|uniref:Pseudouridine synthase n=1 Tax=Falsirhodobacter algicola TaxID=2692330 RepID=A0A8J8SJN1_9RHOB|nr:RluA family pseudouridine synthase [Falsirhodobacter algicola]QUS34975.1 RluA family pseudouridine synthase [Falsirhodobacter algicola]